MSAIDDAMKALNKKFGKNYIGVGSEIMDVDYQRLAIGILPLDYAIGGGIPERKIVMVAGKESSGKTSTLLKAIATAQAQGVLCAFIDVEHGFDPIWATKLGVQVDKLLIAQANTIEQVSDTAETLIMSGEVGLIGVDSVAAAPSQKELDDSSDQKSYAGGGKPVAIGVMMRKLTSRLNDVKNPVTTRVILLNQIRDNVGGWGAPEYCPGGKALHFQCDIIIWLRPDSKPVGGKDNPKGVTVKFKCTKNRTAPPLKTGTYDLMFKGEFNEVAAMVAIGLQLGIINKKGNTHTFENIIAVGKDKFAIAIRKNGLELLREKILAFEGEPVAIDIDEEEDDVFEKLLNGDDESET